MHGRQFGKQCHTSNRFSTSSARTARTSPQNGLALSTARCVSLHAWQIVRSMGFKTTEVRDYANEHGLTYSGAYHHLRVRPIEGPVRMAKDAERTALLCARLDAIDSIEWARLAAFLDGEGSIGIRRRSKGHLYPVLQISNTDPRLPLWLAAIFGGSVGSTTPKNARHKKAYVWSAVSRQAEFIIRRVRPYLLLKGAQADICLAMRETVLFGRNHHNPLSGTVINRREQLFEQCADLNKRGVAE